MNSAWPLWKKAQDLLCARRKAALQGINRVEEAIKQGRKGKLFSPSKIQSQSRFGALGTLDKAHEVEEEPMQEFLPRSERPIPYNKTCNKPAPRRNNCESWSLVVFSFLEQKHPFADRTLFSGRFSASLGHKSGVSSQD